MTTTMTALYEVADSALRVTPVHAGSSASQRFFHQTIPSRQRAIGKRSEERATRSDRLLADSRATDPTEFLLGRNAAPPSRALAGNAVECLIGQSILGRLEAVSEGSRSV